MSQIHSYSEAVDAIEAHIASRGGAHAEWYCGIAADPKDRLFDDHKVNRQNGKWCCRDCGSDVVARKVEDYFHRRGCQGGPGGGSRDTRFVYAYRITLSTLEAA